MKLFSILPLFILGSIISLCCPSCKKSVSSSVAFASETESKSSPNTLDRYYFVKGMTCGGCVIGVKSSLKRVGINNAQILEVDYRSPDPKNSIGHAKVRFSKEEYKGQETDCKIVKEIKSNLGYVAYWDEKDTNPCKL